MPISWRTDYAMRLAYELAALGDGARASVSVLAKSADVPYDFARQIANRLARSGLFVSQRGARGGFALARSASKTTLFEIFLAMDETSTISLCNHAEHDCKRKGWCPVHNGVWKPLDEIIENQLRQTTLADCVVAARTAGRSAG